MNRTVANTSAFAKTAAAGVLALAWLGATACEAQPDPATEPASRVTVVPPPVGAAPASAPIAADDDEDAPAPQLLLPGQPPPPGVQVEIPEPVVPERRTVVQPQAETQPQPAVVAPVPAPAASVPAAAPLPPAAEARPAEVRPGDQPAAPESRQTFSQADLDEMLAPVALYPDSLLSQVLMAATYPLEVVQADRWRRGNANLAGDALANALEEQPWDPSVKSLINTPDVLAMMSDKLDWTVRLGDAFIGQQQEVMDTVQDLRRRAQEAGTLKDSPEQRVTTLVQAEPVVEREIIIERTDPDVVYVPVYDPYVSYGRWWHPYHRPFFWCPPTYPVGWSGIWFGLSYHCGPAWGYAWGRPNWRHRHVDIDVHRHARFNSHIDRDRFQRQFDRRDDNVRVSRNTWVHDPGHRRGVWYRDTDVARRFNAPTPPTLGRGGDRNDALRARRGGTDNFMGPRVTTPSNGGRTTTGNRVPNTSDFMGPRVTTPSNTGRTTNTEGLTTNAQRDRDKGEINARPPVQSPGLKRDDARPTPSLTPARRDALASDGDRGGRGGDDNNIRGGQQRQDQPSERVRVIRPTPVRVAPPSLSADRGGADRSSVDRGGDRGAAFSEVNRDGGSVRSESRRGSISRGPSESSGFRSAPAPRLGSSSGSSNSSMGPSVRSSSPAPSPSRSFSAPPSRSSGGGGDGGGSRGGGGGGGGNVSRSSPAPAATHGNSPSRGR